MIDEQRGGRRRNVARRDHRQWTIGNVRERRHAVIANHGELSKEILHEERHAECAIRDTGVHNFLIHRKRRGQNAGSRGPTVSGARDGDDASDTVVTNGGSGRSREADVVVLSARRRNARRNHPKERVGARERGVEHIGVVVRAFDYLHALASGGVQARRIARDHARRLVTRGEMSERRATDLTGRRGDDDHVLGT